MRQQYLDSSHEYEYDNGIGTFQRKRSRGTTIAHVSEGGISTSSSTTTTTTSRRDDDNHNEYIANYYNDEEEDEIDRRIQQRSRMIRLRNHQNNKKETPLLLQKQSSSSSNMYYNKYATMNMDEETDEYDNRQEVLNYQQHHKNHDTHIVHQHHHPNIDLVDDRYYFHHNDSFGPIRERVLHNKNEEEIHNHATSYQFDHNRSVDVAQKMVKRNNKQNSTIVAPDVLDYHPSKKTMGKRIRGIFKLGSNTSASKDHRDIVRHNPNETISSLNRHYHNTDVHDDRSRHQKRTMMNNPIHLKVGKSTSGSRSRSSARKKPYSFFSNGNANALPPNATNIVQYDGGYENEYYAHVHGQYENAYDSNEDDDALHLLRPNQYKHSRNTNYGNNKEEDDDEDEDFSGYSVSSSELLKVHMMEEKRQRELVKQMKQLRESQPVATNATPVTTYNYGGPLFSPPNEHSVATSSRYPLQNNSSTEMTPHSNATSSHLTKESSALLVSSQIPYYAPYRNHSNNHHKSNKQQQKQHQKLPLMTENVRDSYKVKDRTLPMVLRHSIHNYKRRNVNPNAKDPPASTGNSNSNFDKKRQDPVGTVTTAVAGSSSRVATTVRVIDKNGSMKDVIDGKQVPETTRSSVYAPSISTHKISNRTLEVAPSTGSRTAPSGTNVAAMTDHPPIKSTQNKNIVSSKQKSSYSQLNKKTSNKEQSNIDITKCKSSDSSLFSQLDDDDDVFKEVLLSQQQQESNPNQHITTTRKTTNGVPKTKAFVAGVIVTDEYDNVEVSKVKSIEQSMSPEKIVVSSSPLLTINENAELLQKQPIVPPSEAPKTRITEDVLKNHNMKQTDSRPSVALSEMVPVVPAVVDSSNTNNKTVNPSMGPVAVDSNNNNNKTVNSSVGPVAVDSNNNNNKNVNPSAVPVAVDSNNNNDKTVNSSVLPVAVDSNNKKPVNSSTFPSNGPLVHRKTAIGADAITAPVVPQQPHIQHHQVQVPPYQHRSRPLTGDLRGNNNNKKHLLVETSPVVATTNKQNAHSKNNEAQQREERKRIQDALKRPFGRSSLLLFRPSILKFIVTVSSGEWDAKQHKWLYPIHIQKLKQHDMSSSQISSAGGPTILSNVAQTRRSLSDFLWLERALRYEFHGALLLPPLLVEKNKDTTTNSSSHKNNVTTAKDSASTIPHVESNVLKDWLHDVLNGIRGAGEVVLPYASSPSSSSLRAVTNRNTTMQINGEEEIMTVERLHRLDKYVVNDDAQKHEQLNQTKTTSSFHLLESESLETFFYKKSNSLLDDFDICTMFHHGIASTQPCNITNSSNVVCIPTTATKHIQNIGANVCDLKKDSRQSNNNNNHSNSIDEKQNTNGGFFPFLVSALMNSIEACIVPTPPHFDAMSTRMEPPLSDTVGGFGSSTNQYNNDKKRFVGSSTNSGGVAQLFPTEIIALSTSRAHTTTNIMKELESNNSIDDNDLVTMMNHNNHRQQQQQQLYDDDDRDFMPSPTISSLTSVPNGIIDNHINNHTTTNNNNDNTVMYCSSSEFAIHSEVIEAEKDLLVNYRQTTIRVLDQLNALEKEETKIGSAWKGLALALAALFGYEKNVETTRHGITKTSDHKNNKHQRRGNNNSKDANTILLPFQNISSTDIEESLRIMAKQKMDRSVPALKAVREMIHAYLLDLHTIEPSVEVYTNAIQSNLRLLPTTTTPKNNHEATTTTAETENGKQQRVLWNDFKVVATAAVTGAKQHAWNSLNGGVAEKQQCTIKTDSKDGMDSKKQEDEQQQQKIRLRQEKLLHEEQMIEYRTILLSNERMLRMCLTTMCCATPFRSARMIWKYWNIEEMQCTLVQSAASTVLRTVNDEEKDDDVAAKKGMITSFMERHNKEEQEDTIQEMELIEKIISIGWTSTTNNNSSSQQLTVALSSKKISSNNNKPTIYLTTAEKTRNAIRDEIMELAKTRCGRWDYDFAMKFMSAIRSTSTGVTTTTNDTIADNNDDNEATTSLLFTNTAMMNKDLRRVRTFATGLREHLNECRNALLVLLEAITGNNGTTTSGGSSTTEETSSQPKQHKGIVVRRQEFMCELSNLFSGSFVHKQQQQQLVGDNKDKEKNTSDDIMMIPKRNTASRYVLLQTGIDTSDPFGWIVPSSSSSDEQLLDNNDDDDDNDGVVRYQMKTDNDSNKKKKKKSSGLGKLALQYMNTKDSQIQYLLTSLATMMDEYYKRIETIEGYIYMEIIAIQLEKHYSDQRAKALSLFEQKTELTTALNTATRKQRFLPSASQQQQQQQRIQEIQMKLHQLMGSNNNTVSATSVREAKEAHLQSKVLKTSLQQLAVRRLQRARDQSTKRIVEMITIWAQVEHDTVQDELYTLQKATTALEQSILSCCMNDKVEEKQEDKKVTTKDYNTNSSHSSNETTNDDKYYLYSTSVIDPPLRQRYHLVTS